MKVLLNRTGALGDVLELTPIAQRLLNRGDEVYVKTNYPQVFHDFAGVKINPTHLLDAKAFNLNMAFERTLRKNHPIDDYSQIVFNDTETPHRITFNFPKMDILIQAGQTVKGPYVVVHPARSWPVRTLSRMFWQDLINALVVRGFNVVLTGTKQDWDGLYNCLDLRSHLSLQYQAALIDNAEVFICSESGPMILAQATSTPIIALLTMVEPHRIIHEGPPIFVLRANVPCVGCESTLDSPVTYLDCKHGPNSSRFRSCCHDSSWNVDYIAESAQKLSTRKKG